MTHIGAWLSTAAARQPDQVLHVCDDRSTSARLVQDRVAALAAGLLSSAHLQPGAVVALALRPSDHFWEVLLAVAACGCIPAPLNLRWSAVEASQAINSARATLVVADEAGRKLLQPFGSAVRTIYADVSAGDAELQGCEELIKQHWGAPYTLHHPQNGAAVICFTSGSTGRPKGVVLSHAAFHCQSLAKIVEVGYEQSDTYLHCAPLYHVGGLSSALAYLLLGAKQVFQPRYSAVTTCELIQRHQVSAFIAVPAIVSDIMTHLRTTTATRVPVLRCVKRILLGGGSVSPSQLKDITAAFPNAAVTTAYGMTEACSSMTFLSVRPDPGSHAGARHPHDWGTCVGKPPSGIEVAVRSAAQAAPSAIGEIMTRGPHIMLGYVGEQQCSQVDKDGWLSTGDLGWIDSERLLWLVGRLKDVIRSGSENVHAAEVERVLLQHPAVVAAAVVGLPHSRWGEQVAALLQLSPSTTWVTLEQQAATLCKSAAQMSEKSDNEGLDLSMVRAHCLAAGLSRYKVPLLVFAGHDAVPTNSAGKHVKPAVKALLLQHMQQGGTITSKF